MSAGYVEIIHDLGLQVKEIETDIFQVINPGKEINVQHLGTNLGMCVLLVSSPYIKKIDGYGNTFGNVRYIKLGGGNNDRIYSIWNELAKKGEETLIDVYDNRAFASNTVDTVYCQEEL